MKKLFTGLCMAWGNFCYIPGVKRWNEESRSIMLGWLPLIGLVIGIIWAGLYLGFCFIKLPFLLTAAVVTWLPFILSGFIHVDGFMDVSDATLSRGEVVKRRRILKDSNVGMFAVVTFVFVVLIEYASISTAISQSFDFFNLIMIAMFSRIVSSLEVLNSNPMETSQYKNKPSAKEGNIMNIIFIIVALGLAALFCKYYIATALVIAVTVLGTLIPITIAKKNLGGMNGDIAGYGIVWGELMGIISLVLC